MNSFREKLYNYVDCIYLKCIIISFNWGFNIVRCCFFYIFILLVYWCNNVMGSEIKWKGRLYLCYM